jgi:DNA-directed RNA polymerase specialized sigma24 family protein
MKSELTEVRMFLNDLAGGRRDCADLPRVFFRWAADASKGTGIGGAYEVEDVVLEFLQRLAAGEARQTAYGAMTDLQLRGALRRRLRQTAVELSDGWDGYKALRAHVGRVLDDGVPTAPVERPLSLLEGSQFAHRHVAAAVAWLLANEADQDGTPSRLTQRLARLYLPSFVSIDAVNEDVEWPDWGDDAANDDVEAEHDATVLARRLAQLLTRSEARVLQQRLDGEELRLVAEREGCALATAHAREKAAVKKVSAFVRRAGVSLGTLRRIVRKVVA